jgi:hypothetical protein
VKTTIVVAIIGVIISAVITQIFNFGLLPHDSMNAPMVRHALTLTSTISRAGGLLIFFFALLRRQEHDRASELKTTEGMEFGLRSGETSMKKGIKIVLWIVVAVFTLIAVNSFSDSSGSSDPNTGKLGEALGRLIGTVFGVAAAALGVALLLWRK